MTIHSRNGFSRRTFLRIAAGLGTAAALPAAAATQAVLTRPIPSSGERIPIVGIGTSRVFDIGEDRETRAERAAVLRTLVEGGGRVIDTAPSYGNAESVLGDLLSAAGLRDKVFLATKVRASSREAAEAQMRQSLARLRTKRVDLMQWHNVSDADMSLEQLRAWRAQGITRYVGITHYLDRALDVLEEVMRREKPDFVQLKYSLAEREAEDRMLPAAADTGTAVLVNLPFGRGRLFRAVRGKPLPPWAAEFGAATWGQFFLKYILGHPAVTCVIPGTDKTEYMTDNLGAGRAPLPDAAMRRRMAAYWESIA